MEAHIKLLRTTNFHTDGAVLGSEWSGSGARCFPHALVTADHVVRSWPPTITFEQIWLVNPFGD